ncbi:MAG: hypothetical protein Q8M08_03210 [Bacteroidales bacterium]|nr:hypothetical protein [Bacteroidales bacterium]
MKTSTIIIAAILTLNTGLLFAGNETTTASVTNRNRMISLAPSMPLEATFEDAVTIETNNLIPVLPAEAEFNDTPSEMVSFADLAPVTPAVADFDAAVEVIWIDLATLAPRTPAEADFE